MMDCENIKPEVIQELASKDITFDAEKIKELMQLLHDLGMAELEIETPVGYLRISRYSEQPMVVQQAIPAQQQPVAQPVAQAVPQKAEEPTGQEAESVDENLHEIKSPIVGTFYRAPAPGEAPFVEVGDHVNPGDVLCIVEAMKVMNQIKSDVAGTIVEILPKNGEPVEYGQVLFRIRPD